MRQRLTKALIALLCGVCLLSMSLPRAEADDLAVLKVPVYRDRAGFGLAVTQYSMQTDAPLLAGNAAKHTLDLSGLLQPPTDADVLCFSTTLVATAAHDKRGTDLLEPDRRRNRTPKFKALRPSPDYKTRLGQPLFLSESKLDSISLKRTGYEVQKLTVAATALVVKARESKQIDAQVADRFIDIGHGTSVQVSSIKVDKKSEITVKLKVNHLGNKSSPVIDSLYALNQRGEAMGGGRWTNDLDLFAKSYEVDLVFPLNGDEKSIDQLRIVLATQYDIEKIEFVIDGLFQQ